MTPPITPAATDATGMAILATCAVLLDAVTGFREALVWGRDRLCEDAGRLCEDDALLTDERLGERAEVRPFDLDLAVRDAFDRLELARRAVLARERPVPAFRALV